jgi:similar to stage IV sporulation protein
LPQHKWPREWSGQLVVDLTGGEVSRFINEATRAGFELRSITWMGPSRVRCTLFVPDFFRLRPLLRSTGTKVRIVQKKGFPFLWMRFMRRRFFALGVLLFLLLLFGLSSVVWSIEVEGNERIPETELRTLLREEGVYIGQLKQRIKPAEEIQYRLGEKMPQLSWVGFRIEGTRAVLTVVEKKQVEDLPEKQEQGPVHLVAKRGALITDMQVERGRPVVEVQDVVKKGQLLVSGRYGDPQNEETGHLVGAKGKVWGQVWYESVVEVPLTQKRKVYTGNRTDGYYPYIAARMIRFPFAQKELFAQSESIHHVKTIRWGGWRLPFGWVREERLEMEWVEKKLSKQEAIALGVERAREDLLSQMGEESSILDQKVLHPRVDSGKVVMKIQFDAVENIADPQPILQGE